MLLEMKNACKYYGKGELTVKAMDDITLSLESGKIYVILGPSGSGKSTFMNIVGGLDSLTSGSIVVNDQELNRLNKKQLTEYRKKEIGFVFQSYNLIPDLTVKENIKVGLDIAENPLNIDDLMKALGIAELSSRFPKELSGGQQQRVAVARAMIKRPGILLCDELTGALDTESSKAVLEQVEQMNRMYKTTVMMITHNESISEMADQIIRIRNGRIIEQRVNENKKTASEIDL